LLVNKLSGAVSDTATDAKGLHLISTSVKDGDIHADATKTTELWLGSTDTISRTPTTGSINIRLADTHALGHNKYNGEDATGIFLTKANSYYLMSTSGTQIIWGIGSNGSKASIEGKQDKISFTGVWAVPENQYDIYARFG